MITRVDRIGKRILDPKTRTVTLINRSNRTTIQLTTAQFNRWLRAWARDASA